MLLYFGDESYLINDKYRNILLKICIIIYSVYKKDVLCNIKRLFFLHLDLSKVQLSSLKYKKCILLANKN